MGQPAFVNGEALSEDFRTHIVMAKEPAYRIAIRAGLHPSTLSKLLSGQERIKPSDPRVIAVGREVGLSPRQCFKK
jgi:hypothetical protein